MAGTTLDLSSIVNEDALASSIANKWNEWTNYRSQKVEEWKELRNYVYATDTTTTTNAMLPWSNSTTTPKITQIMDNLHANYFAALFPNSDWLRFEAMDKNSNTKKKRDSIQAYMDTKLRQSGFINTVSELLYDFILYGNCFATVSFEDSVIPKSNTEAVLGYRGPKVQRISPYDIVFDPTAADFKSTPKVIRSVVSLGEIKRLADSNSEMAEVFQKMLEAREVVGRATSDAEIEKADAYIADGFSSITNYYSSNYVEVLTFYGDIYNQDEGEFMSDRIITVIDRAYVVGNIESPSWLGSAPIFHAGWRTRPDNLYAMGPLDNLVGMQYRIDHLENLKADVFDQIAYPILKIKGDVPDFEFEPNARIYLGEEGDVGYMAPDTSALNADTQIAILEQKMEEFAGAPRQAMGLRTAGEKTAFEVQVLDNAANRIFVHKTAHFERTFLEPILNAMLETGRRNMVDFEEIMITEADNTTIFKTVQKSDIIGNGKIIAKGARHFTESAKRTQTLTQLLQIKQQDPTVGVHMSGKTIARLLSEELNEPELYRENVQVSEQAETQKRSEEIQVAAEEQRQRAIEKGF